MDTQSALSQLAEGVRGLTTSERWTDWLKMQAKFHAYSWRNTMLIWLQKPDATQCAGYRKWQELGRQVRKGEKGIAILAPIMPSKKMLADNPDSRPVFFRAVAVFDVSQTDGVELPKPVSCIDGDGMADTMNRLADGLRGEGYTVDMREEQTESRGWINGKEIVINTRGRAVNDQFRTLVHEGAHGLLEHQANGTDKEEREIVAESTAYVVCESLGVDSGSYSFGYVASWASNNDPVEARKIMQAAMAAIDRTSKRILTFCSA